MVKKEPSTTWKKALDLLGLTGQSRSYIQSAQVNPFFAPAFRQPSLILNPQAGCLASPFAKNTMRPTILLLLAIVVFGIAQFVPAIRLDMGAWNKPDEKALSGIFFTITAWPYYLSNFLLVLSPLLVYAIGRLNRSRRYFIVLFSLYLMTPISAIFWKKSILNVSMGFYLWITTFCIAALGVALAMKQKSKSEQGADGQLPTRSESKNQ